MPSGFRLSRLLEDQKSLGRDKTPEWRAVRPHEEQQLALARIQHRLALQLRRALGSGAADTLAENSNQDPHYVIRKLNGQVPVTALDLIVWTDAAGIDLETTLADSYPDTDASSTDE